MGKTIARSVVSELTCTSLNREVLVLYRTEDAYYVGSDRYAHGDYAIAQLEKEYENKTRDRKVGYWWLWS